MSAIPPLRTSFPAQSALAAGFESSHSGEAAIIAALKNGAPWNEIVGDVYKCVKDGQCSIIHNLIDHRREIPEGLLGFALEKAFEQRDSDLMRTLLGTRGIDFPRAFEGPKGGQKLRIFQSIVGSGKASPGILGFIILYAFKPDGGGWEWDFANTVLKSKPGKPEPEIFPYHLVYALGVMHSDRQRRFSTGPCEETKYLILPLLTPESYEIAREELLLRKDPDAEKLMEPIWPKQEPNRRIGPS